MTQNMTYLNVNGNKMLDLRTDYSFVDLKYLHISGLKRSVLEEVKFESRRVGSQNIFDDFSIFFRDTGLQKCKKRLKIENSDF
jgi:hypothetical protein